MKFQRFYIQIKIHQIPFFQKEDHTIWNYTAQLTTEWKNSNILITFSELPPNRNFYDGNTENRPRNPQDRHRHFEEEHRRRTWRERCRLVICRFRARLRRQNPSRGWGCLRRWRWGKRKGCERLGIEGSLGCLSPCSQCCRSNRYWGVEFPFQLKLFREKWRENDAADYFGLKNKSNLAVY